MKSILVVALLPIGTANANEYLLKAWKAALGCNTTNDIFDIRRSKNALQVFGQKIAAGKCFSISPGQMAYGASEWQDENLWRGITRLKTQSGRKFYTDTDDWVRVGEVPNLIP